MKKITNFYNYHFRYAYLHKAVSLEAKHNFNIINKSNSLTEFYYFFVKLTKFNIKVSNFKLAFKSPRCALINFILIYLCTLFVNILGDDCSIMIYLNKSFIRETCD